MEVHRSWSQSEVCTLHISLLHVASLDLNIVLLLGNKSSDHLLWSPQSSIKPSSLFRLMRMLHSFWCRNQGTSIFAYVICNPPSFLVVFLVETHSLEYLNRSIILQTKYRYFSHSKLFRSIRINPLSYLHLLQITLTSTSYHHRTGISSQNFYFNRIYLFYRIEFIVDLLCVLFKIVQSHLIIGARFYFHAIFLSYRFNF